MGCEAQLAWKCLFMPTFLTHKVGHNYIAWADFPKVAAKCHIFEMHTPGGYNPKIWIQPRFLYNASNPQVSSSYVHSFGKYRLDKQTNKQTNKQQRWVMT